MQFSVGSWQSCISKIEFDVLMSGISRGNLEQRAKGKRLHVDKQYFSSERLYELNTSKFKFLLKDCQLLAHRSLGEGGPTADCLSAEALAKVGRLNSIKPKKNKQLKPTFKNLNPQHT